MYDLFVRSRLVLKAAGKVNALSKSASAVVNAGAQAKSLEKLRPLLTDEEAAIETLSELIDSDFSE